jgi:Fungal chitosanase of glycosyl hydrolase group 75
MRRPSHLYLRRPVQAALTSFLLSTFVLSTSAFAAQPPSGCNSKKLFDVREQQWQGTGQSRVQGRYQVEGKNGFFFTSGMTIDADGSPRAFHRVSSKGLDDLANAGHPGDWWGIMTDSRETDGKPIVQGPQDPAPGFYISQTGLEDKTKKETDPRRYVDALKVPYIVLSGTRKQNLNANFGDYAVVYNAKNKKFAYALYGDEWPTIKVGEGSVALAKELGIDADPREGGAEEGITYLIFPNSRKTPWRAEETVEDLRREAEKHFQAWGGIDQLAACVGK